jgi:hypothetical protein
MKREDASMLTSTEHARHAHIVDNLWVGKAQVDPAAPAHQRGIRQGNKHGSIARERGIHPTGAWSARGSAERSTGINARARNPIDPRSPNLSPP